MTKSSQPKYFNVYKLLIVFFLCLLSVFSFVNFASSAQSNFLKVTKSGDGYGAVKIESPDAADIICKFNKNDNSSCSGSYPKGADVTVTATADSGSNFGGLGGACSGSSSFCTISAMNTDKKVNVFFNLGSGNNNSSSVPSFSGSPVEIIANPNPVEYGKSATLTWTAESGPGACYLYSPTDNLKTIKSDAYYLESSSSRFFKGAGYYAPVSRNSNGVTANLTTATYYTLTCDIETTNNAQSSPELKVDVADSKKFVIGNLIYATDNVSVRDTASLSGVILGRQSFGSLGKVVGGPSRAGSYSWWKIDYNNAPDGWSAENYLEKRNKSSSSSSSSSSSLSGKATTFGYTGGSQKYIVPSGITSVNIKAYGAQGDSSGVSGGLGGFAEANISVSPGETLYVYVGGQKGWNGGGKGDPWTYFGGGASDVRRSGMSLSDRLIVAGGGGGSGTRTDTYYGGSGGGSAGEDGANANGANGGRGATNLAGGVAGSIGPVYIPANSFLRKSSPGALGVGGDGGFTNCSSYGGGGGGGGGYYGGGGGGVTCNGGAAGGGGSSFVPTGGTTLSNSRSGDGQVIVTAIK